MADEADAPVEGSTMEDALRRTIHQQEVVISVLRDRLQEVEMDLINSRCAMLDHVH